MPANSTHPDYDASLPGWLRARDVIAGEDAVKKGDIKYLPRLDSQSENEYLGYKTRACFFNATSRTADGFLGLLFRRDPEVKLPDRHAGVGGALRVFTDDVDLMGTSLFTFCKGVVSEVLAVGRSGTLIDWQADGESRAYVVRYAAEDILNWQAQRINGRNVVTMIALRELVERPDEKDPFVVKHVETIRVLKLDVLPDGSTRYVVEVWVLADGHRAKSQSSWMGNFWSGQKPSQSKSQWTLVETRIPLRLGNPYQWNVYVSLDGGVTFSLPEDYWVSGEGREFAPDGGSELHFIVGVDANGKEITVRSNPICPDDCSPPTPPAQDFTGYNYNSPEYTTIDDGSTVVAANGSGGNGTYTFSGGSAWNEFGDWLFPSNDNDGNPVWQICLQYNTDMYWSDFWNPIDPSA